MPSESLDMMVIILFQPSASNLFCNAKWLEWQPLQLLAKICFSLFSWGVFSGKLFIHSTPVSCLEKSLSGLSCNAGICLPGTASALTVSNPCACAQRLYLVVLPNDGKT